MTNKNKTTDLIPMGAIIFFSGQEVNPEEHIWVDTKNIEHIPQRLYAEFAKIENNEITDQYPLTLNLYRALIDSLVHGSEYAEMKKEYILPHNILFAKNQHGKRTVTFYEGPSEKKMIFSKSCKIPDGTVKIPGMIYHVTHNGSVNVYFYKGKSRPTLKTKLYMAPFYNVSKSGRLCSAGYVEPYSGKVSYEKFIEKILDAFWKTEFSHEGGSSPKRKLPGNFWKDLIKSGRRVSIASLHESPMKTMETLINSNDIS